MMVVNFLIYVVRWKENNKVLIINDYILMYFFLFGIKFKWICFWF